MTWNRAKAEDRLRRLMASCHDSAGTAQWAPHLFAFCEELSQNGADAWKDTRNEILLTLLEAGPFFALRGQVSDFLGFIDPLLLSPPKQLLDDIFSLMTEPILQQGGFGQIGAAVEDLKRYAKRKDDTQHWVAYAKTLSSCLNALYSLKRFSTADSFHKHFADVPLKFSSVTRMFESQALLDMAIWHAQEGEGVKVEMAVRGLKALANAQPAEQLRRNYAAGVVAWTAELITRDEVGTIEEQGEVLFQMVSKYPEDVELGSEFLHYLAAGLPALLAEGRSELALRRWTELHQLFRHSEALGEKGSELALALAEEHPELLAEHAEGIRGPLDKLEELYGSGSPTLAERCRRAREVAGLPPRAKGCLGVVLALLLLATVS